MSMLVVYYSHIGNNQFIAHNIAQEFKCEQEQLQPKARSFGALLFATFTGLSRGNRALTHNVGDYTTIVLCAPVWMGSLAAPAMDFLKRYGKTIRKLYVVSCCGSTESDKAGKFGYETVFKKVRAIAGPALVGAYPLSVGLTIEESKRETTNMTTVKLSNDTFTGTIKEHYDDIIAVLRNQA